MKILKPGKLPATVPRFIGKCTKCGCEVECDATEVCLTGQNFFNKAPTGAFVSCPTPSCKATIVVKPVPASSGCNASNTPANVLPISENCNHRLQREGKPNPRTCAVCKLGPCAFRLSPPPPAPLPPPPGEQPMPDYRAFPRPDPYAACPLTIGGKPFTAEEFYNR